MNRNPLLTGALLGGLLGATAGSVHADLFFDVPAGPFEIGETIDVDVIIDGLGETGAPSLGSYDIDIGFDDALLDYQAFVPTEALGSFTLPAFFPEATETSAGEVAAGSVNIGVFSTLSGGALDALQSAQFALGTLTFEALGAGLADLSFTRNVLADGDSNQITPGAALGASVEIADTASVPLPPTLLLAVLGLALTRRR